MKLHFIPVLIGAVLLWPSAAMACRNPPEPSDLRHEEADAIVLTTMKDVRPTTENKWSTWVATASVSAELWGRAGEHEISFADDGPGSCQLVGKPRLGKYYVLYLRKIDGRIIVRPMPIWWAWQSGDPRLAKLMKLMPLGPVRAPAAEEIRLLDYAEPRVRLPQPKTALQDYTRIYARSSAGSVRAVLLRSRTPRRLMVDHDEEMPTEKSCGCQLHEQFVDLQDLWTAGKLPPFEP